MSIILGNNTISGIYLGNNNIPNAFLGNQQIYSSGVNVTLLGAVSETITCSNGQTFTTNASGYVVAKLPLGTFTFIGSKGGYQVSATITNITTQIKVMPAGALYWFGNKLYNWVSANIVYMGNTTPIYPSISYGTNAITIGGTSLGNYSQGVVYIPSAIDVTNFSQLNVTVTGKASTWTTSSDDIAQGVFSQIKAALYPYRLATGTIANKNSSLTTFTTNLASVTGNRYIAIFLSLDSSYSSPISATISKIWLS